ncbi:hypothetical protein CBOM_03476 [Ceraceosorus bombacis]|uniref:Uncharacterized protein n=1 Tax=Ceraceosorus bombacis TaxID=401625 RepID=A0A0N7LAS9_9BASI|nr:hypothetical protein CBOM_03476 [Ceraceosorus bombacis]
MTAASCGGYISTDDREPSVLDVDDVAPEAVSKPCDEIKTELGEINEEEPDVAATETGPGDKAKSWLRREIRSAYEGLHPPVIRPLIIDGCFLCDESHDDDSSEPHNHDSSESHDYDSSESQQSNSDSTAQTDVSVQSSADTKGVADDDASTQVQLGRSIKTLPTRPSVRVLADVLLAPFTQGVKRTSETDTDAKHSAAKRLRTAVAPKKQPQKEVPIWIRLRRLRRHQEDVERRMKLKRRADADDSVPLEGNRTKRRCLAGDILVSQDTLFQLLVPRAAPSSLPSSPISSWEPSFIRTETRVRSDSVSTDDAMDRIAQVAPIFKRGEFRRRLRRTVASLETLSIA